MIVHDLPCLPSPTMSLIVLCTEVNHSLAYKNVVYDRSRPQYNKEIIAPLLLWKVWTILFLSLSGCTIHWSFMLLNYAQNAMESETDAVFHLHQLALTRKLPD